MTVFTLPKPAINHKIINWLDVTWHKTLVLWYVLKACRALLRRALVHDMSKYSRDEANYYEQYFFDLLNVPYGSKEYDELQKRIRPAKLHHFQNNTHHPEHWQGGIKEMTPLDLVEMLCDWKAATMGHKDGNFDTSLVINGDRYAMPDTLKNGLVANAKEIGLNND